MAKENQEKDHEPESINNFKKIEVEHELPPTEVERQIMRKIGGAQIVGQLIDTFVTRLFSIINMMFGGKK